MDKITPTAIFDQLVEAVPEEFHRNIIVVGSVAAGYHFFHNKPGQRFVRTKDIDCLLSPRKEAVHSAEAVTKELISRGWKHKEGWTPGTADTDTDDLPAIRLRPPQKDVTWFCELLAVPDKGVPGKQWLRVSVGQDLPPIAPRRQPPCSHWPQNEQVH